jgi:UPF0716 protein FxsA
MVWFVIFVVWPLAELFVIVKVSEAIGFLWMLLLLIVSWPVGSRILRAQGRAAWRQFGEAIQAGRPPANEALNGALVLAGGLLLMVPGFITDAIGLLLLLPPTRALARRALARHHTSIWVGRAASFGSAAGFRGNRRNSGADATGARHDYDADATAVDIDDRELNP